MAKIPALKKQQVMADFDFSDFMVDDSPSDEAVAGIMSGLVEAHRHQQQTAIELTKLVIENNTAGPISEKEIFSTFKHALQMIEENSPVKKLWEKMSD